jgi:hypothetical protein
VSWPYDDDSEFRLVAVKRDWMPETLFSMFKWVIPYPPFKWIFTKPVSDVK